MRYTIIYLEKAEPSKIAIEETAVHDSSQRINLFSYVSCEHETHISLA